MSFEPKVLAVLVVAFVAACGKVATDPWGRDDDDKMDTSKMVDAGAGIDAPRAMSLEGLGQKCDIAKGGTDCPATAPVCIDLVRTTAYCSPICLSNATATGSATGGFVNIMPALDNTKCAAVYRSTIGTPTCSVGVAWTPMDPTPVSGTNYTSFAAGCTILCGPNNACPPSTAPRVSGTICNCLPL